MARRRAAGQDVTGLLEGEPDLPTPREVVDATARALREGRTRYSPSAGLPELREALARRLREKDGVPCEASGVLVANGAKQALFDLLQAAVGPGDEVLIPSPHWPSHPAGVILAGATPVLVHFESGRFDLAALERAATRRTRAVIVNTPNNPTGAVYSRDDLRALAALAAERDWLLISDEAYEQLVYDVRRHVSLAAVSRDAARRTATVKTFSKSYSMTGFRVGYAAIPEELSGLAARVHSQVTGNVCTFAQAGALAALSLPASFHEKRRAEFERRRDLAVALAQPLFDVVEPEGGFFVWADARRHLTGRVKTSSALAARLLDRGGVAVVPGSACGQEGFLRIAFSSSRENIEKGFARLAAALA